MTFFKIQDPNKRDEIVREMNERRKRIYQDSILSDVSFQTGNNMSLTSCANESEGGPIQNSSNQEVPSTIREMQKLMNVGAVASHYIKMYTSNNISNKN